MIKYYHYKKYLRLFFLLAITFIFSYKYLKKNDYKSMVTEIVFLNKKTKCLLINNYIDKKNYILLKTIENIEHHHFIVINNKKYHPIGVIHGYYIFPVDIKPSSINYYHGKWMKSSDQYIKLNKQGEIIEEKNISLGGIGNFIIKNKKLYGINTPSNKPLTFKKFFKKFSIKPLDKKKGVDGIIDGDHYKSIVPHKYLQGKIINEYKLDKEMVHLIVENKKIHNVQLKVIDQALEPKKYFHQLSFYLHKQKDFKIYYYQPLGIIIKETPGQLYIIRGPSMGPLLSVNNKKIYTIDDFIHITTSKKFNLSIQYNKQIKNFQGIRNYRNNFITQWIKEEYKE